MSYAVRQYGSDYVAFFVDALVCKFKYIEIRLLVIPHVCVALYYVIRVRRVNAVLSKIVCVKADINFFDVWTILQQPRIMDKHWRTIHYMQIFSRKAI
jgi:hypothetical protein